MKKKKSISKDPKPRITFPEHGIPSDRLRNKAWPPDILVHLEFDDFVYGVRVSRDVVGEKIACSREKLEYFMGFLLDEIIQGVEQWGKESVWLDLVRTPAQGCGWAFICKGPYAPTAEPYYWTCHRAIDFFYYPPVWVKESAIKDDGTVDHEAMGKVVYRTKLDAGIACTVTCDGHFVLDFTEWMPGAFPIYQDGRENGVPMDDQRQIGRNRIAVANCLLLCLHSSQSLARQWARTKRITVEHVGHRISIDNRGGGSTGDYSRGLLAARREGNFKDKLNARWDQRISGRVSTISEKALNRGFRMLDSILKLPLEQGLVRLDLYSSALGAMTQNNYVSCLCDAWFVSESLLNQLWKEYLESKDRCVEEEGGTSGERFMSSKRMNLLTGRDMTASMMTNLLNLSEKLPYYLYKQCNIVRSARNSWVHGLTPVTAEAAKEALALASELFHLVLGLGINVTTSGSYSASIIQIKPGDPLYPDNASDFKKGG